MRIAFDIDGVFTDYEWFLNEYGGKYLKRHGEDGCLKNSKAYTFRDRFGCSGRTEHKFFARYLFWYARKMPVREDVSVVLNKLKQEGNCIYIITARALADKKNILGVLMRIFLKRWLRKNDIPYDSISYVSVEHSVAAKSMLCKEKRVELFVEDDPENIEVLKKQCKVICMEAGYNEKIRKVEYAVDFGEVFQIIHDQKPIRLRYHEFMQLNEQERTYYLYHLKKYYEKMPFDERYKRKYERFIIWSVRGISLFCRLLFPLSIMGKKNLDQIKPAIYICNHRSALDIILCYCILGAIPARFLAKSDIRWYHFLQRKAGTIFVDRGNWKSRMAAKNKMLHTLLHGGNVLLYPEGTRNRTQQVMLPFRYSAVAMAQITGCPIVPIVIRKIEKRYCVQIASPEYICEIDDVETKTLEIREKMCRIYKDMY